MKFIALVIKGALWMVVTHPWISLAIFLLLFFIFAFPRRVKYNGVQEMADGSYKHVHTIENTGGTFFTDHRVIGVGELAKRRKKFGVSVWSWPLTIVVMVGFALTLRALLAN